MPLTEQQINHFRTFGFVIFRQLLSPDEVARLSREVDDTVARWAPPGRHDDGRKNTYVNLISEESPFSASLLDDPRFADAAEQLLGQPILPVQADARYFRSTMTGWHPDGGPELPESRQMEYTGIKFAIYLEPLNATNGSLRLLPGTQRGPIWADLYEKLRGFGPERAKRSPEDAFGVPADQLPAYVCETEPGDIIAFELPLWHAAFGGGRRRRQATVCYYIDPQTPEATYAYRQTMRRNHEAHAQWQGNRPYFPAYFRAVGDPRHQRWVTRMAELGVLDAPEPASAGSR